MTNYYPKLNSAGYPCICSNKTPKLCTNVTCPCPSCIGSAIVYFEWGELSPYISSDCFNQLNAAGLIFTPDHVTLHGGLCSFSDAQPGKSPMTTLNYTSGTWELNLQTWLQVDSEWFGLVMFNASLLATDCDVLAFPSGNSGGFVAGNLPASLTACETGYLGYGEFLYPNASAVVDFQ